MNRPAGFSNSGSEAVACADVIVVGGGLIGLAAAAAMADRGLTVHIVSESRPGEASAAAAGLLAPSVEEISSARAFGIASRDRYPSYLEWLRDQTGISVPLNRKGILEVAQSDEEVAHLRRGSGEWVDSAALATLEPALSANRGAAFHHTDGAVDNVVLLGALVRLTVQHPRITVERAAVASIDAPQRVVQTRDGGLRSSSAIVIAAGAWVNQLRGLPRVVPVEPVRGQMLSRTGTSLHHAAFGAGIYLVPRDSGHTLIGSTMERVGFDATTTGEALDTLLGAARRLCPSLGQSREYESWAGLRPVTPDMLPIVDRDPEYPSLLYACGHSRNGILMAPLTADCIADMVTAGSSAHDISPFAITRFREPVPG